MLKTRTIESSFRVEITPMDNDYMAKSMIFECMLLGRKDYSS